MLLKPTLRWWSKLLCLFLCLISYAVSEAAMMHDNQRAWLSMESEHFVVHYHEDETNLAKRALHIAESVHHKLAPLFSWSPQSKTAMILSDETDISNGFATPFPSNRMTLYIGQPHLVNSLEDHNGWLKTLILHEYVHILHMDKARGGLEVARGIFGRLPLLFPNVFMPPWMHEGLATYLETDHTQGIGRGQSSYFSMMMRVEVQAGVKPISQMNQPMLSWPLLTSRYLYGVYFQKFLSEIYGRDTWQKVVHSYSDHAVPYRINGVYEDVLGKDLSALWKEFTLYLQDRFQVNIAKLAKKSLHQQGKALTQTGDFKRSVLQAKDGRIFFISDHMLKGAKLMVKENSNGEAQVLADVHAGARLDWHERAGLLLAQPDLCRNANTYYDLYRIDPDSGASTRLTHCQRYIYAAWSTDASAIIAVLNKGGQHALHRLNQQGELQAVLWQGKAGETLSHIDWSADGKTVVTAVWRADSGWNVEEFDVALAQWRMLTHDAAIETDARYVGETREVIFSADSDGVYNIHRLTAQGERQQISHVFGGAFSPWLDGQGDLLYVGYGSQGFDVWQGRLSLSEPYVEQRQVKQLEQEDMGVPIAISEPMPYSPWASLLPTSWLPVWGGWADQGSEYGASTSGSDALKRHQYSAYLGYHSVAQDPTLQFSYLYDGWQPLLQLSASQIYRPSVDPQGALIALSKEQAWDVGLVFPDLSMDAATAWQVGVSYQQSSLAWLHPKYVVTGKLGARDVLAGLAWSQDTRIFSPRSASYTDGSLRSVMLETGKLLGGDYAGAAVTSSWQQHFGTADRSILGMLRGQLAWQSDDARAYQLGGIDQGGSPAANMLQVGLPFHQRNFPLRGYSSNAHQLSGHQLALVTAEMRIPLARIERGWMVPPIGLDQLFGQLFVDAGAVNNRQVYVGKGVELGMDVVFFYGVKVRLFLGYAQGNDPNIGGEFTYLRLSSGF